jgi:hypothetical protein
MRKGWLLMALFSALLVPAEAAVKKIKVFVALCDNATQGIAPVPAKIGDGNLPAQNLYWGCSDGLSSYFKASKSWKLQPSPATHDETILDRLLFTNDALDCELTAEAWRGSQIAACLQAFEKTLVAGEHQLVVFIGHNVLMDKAIAPPAQAATKPCDAIVLCCKSDAYFRERLTTLKVRPVLLTQQLMYPGAFLLHDCLVPWSQGKSLTEIRQAAAQAYARNQKISPKAAIGIFKDLAQ